MLDLQLCHRHTTVHFTPLASVCPTDSLAFFLVCRCLVSHSSHFFTAIRRSVSAAIAKKGFLMYVQRCFDLYCSLPCRHIIIWHSFSLPSVDLDVSIAF